MLLKKSNGLISIIQTLLHRKQHLRGGILTLNMVVDTNDAEQSGCPNLRVDMENIKNLHKLVLANRKLKLHVIAPELKISEGSVFTILHEEAVLKVGAAFAHSQLKTY